MLPPRLAGSVDGARFRFGRQAQLGLRRADHHGARQELEKLSPAIGSAAASVESVRLDPELRQALAERAEQDDESTSSVIRKALRKYLQVG